jgi:hypothetical protein
MARHTELEDAFDAAISETQKSLAAGMTTATGENAHSALEKLQQELERERQAAIQRGSVDREWFQTTVRWLVDWAPETDLNLIAAMGRIARASAPIS